MKHILYSNREKGTMTTAFAIDGNYTVKVHGGTERGHIRLTSRRKTVTDKITIGIYSIVKHTTAVKEKEKRIPSNGKQAHVGL